jgi:hypothetical protein
VSEAFLFGRYNMPKEKLETVDLSDIEILAVGTWKGSSGPVAFVGGDLDNIVSAYGELTGDKNLNYEPPAKLGHDANQKLLQEDGYPAAGWVSALRRAGDKLVCDLKAVPKKIGDLIKAGGYKKVSAEVYSDYEIGGKKYPKVLKAISLLGGDIPAVKTLNDIVAQYGEAGQRAQITAVLYELAEESLSKRVDAIYQAWGKQNRDPFTTDLTGFVLDVFTDYVIVSKADKYYKVPYSVSQTGEHVFATAQAVQVERVYQEIKNVQEEYMEKEIRKLLGLAEDADIVGAVKALKDKAETVPAAGAVSLAEHEAATAKLTEKVATLETRLAEREQKIVLSERDARVEKAIASGKVTPAQKKWADEYALKDPSGFDAFVTAAPVVVEVNKERGSGAETPADVQLTEAEISMGEKLGVPKEELIKAKKQ